MFDFPPAPPALGRSRWSYLLAGALLLACSAASLWGWQLSARSLAQEADREFVRYSELSFTNIGQRVQHQIDLLTSFQALFRAGAAVGTDDFSRHYDEMQVQSRFPGVQAIQYSELVSEARRPAFEAMAARESGADFRIHPPGPRAEYMAVRFNLPSRGNEAALGLDTQAAAGRREVADRARDSGRPEASAPIRLVQGRPGFVVRLPVYRHGLPLNTVDQRRAAHSGQVTGVLLSDHVLRDVLPGLEDSSFRVTVTDRGLIDAPATAELPANVEVARLDGPVRDLSPGPVDAAAGPADRREHNLSMAGRLWRVEVARPHVNHALAPLPLAVLGGGMAIGLLLSVVVGRLSWLRQRAHLLAWQLSEQARAAADRLQVVFNSTADGIVTLGPKGHILSANPALLRLFGSTSEQLLGQDIGLLLTHGAPTQTLPWRPSAPGVAESADQTGQWQARRHDGQLIPVELAINKMEVQGQPQWVAVVRDLSEAVAAQQRIAASMRALQAANELRESVFRHASLALVVTDPQGQIQAVNPAAEQLLDCSAATVNGKALLASFHDSADIARMDQVMRRLREAAAADLTSIGPLGIERQAHYQRHDGSRVPVSITLSALRDGDGQVSGYLSISVDITERQLLAEQLARLAYHDGLTGLANRILLEDRLRQAIAHTQTHDLPLALLFIDLDRFKQINDEHGHAVGDQVLCEVARRLQATLRQHDLVARLGGDEFVVLLNTLASDQDAALVADKLISVLSAPMTIGAHQLQVGASIGASTYPEAGEDAAAMLRAADAAMYRAKQAGRRAMDRLSRRTDMV